MHGDDPYRLNADGPPSEAAPTPGRETGSVGETPVRAAPNFCSACGAPWDPAWEACPRCASVQVARAAHNADPSQRGSHPLGTALGLYFCFLSTFVCHWIITSQAAAILTMEALDSAIVLIWTAACFPLVRSVLSSVPAARWFGLAVAAGAGTFLIATASINFLTSVIPFEVFEISAPFIDAGFGRPFVILAACIQPALIEELAFRGVILTSLQRLLNDREAIIVSAMMFMVIHLTAPSFPHLLVIGLVLGWLRVRTHSLYPCMVMHFVHNLLCVWEEQGQFNLW